MAEISCSVLPFADSSKVCIQETYSINCLKNTPASRPFSAHSPSVHFPFQAIILIRHDSQYCDILSVFWGFSRGRWSLTEHLRAAGLGRAPPVCGQVFIKASFLSVGSSLSGLDPPHRSRPVRSTADLREKQREWKQIETERGYIPLCLMCLS